MGISGEQILVSVYAGEVRCCVLIGQHHDMKAMDGAVSDTACFLREDGNRIILPVAVCIIQIIYNVQRKFAPPSRVTY
jgi:hypothetical protein